MKTIILLSILLGISRFFVQMQPFSMAGSYAAIAHLFLGILIGLAIADKYRWWCITLVGVLSVVEVFAVLHSRIGG